MTAPYVSSQSIKTEVKGREADIVRGLGIPWRGRDHIRCPYPGHVDKHPSWRLTERGLAICTCRTAHSVFEIIMAMEGIDFEAAKIRAAELIGRKNLIKNGATAPGLTLAEFAQLKKLPAEWLMSQGLRNGKRGIPAVCIPFFNQSGGLQTTQFRIGMGKNDKYFKKGTTTCLYGANRAALLKEAGYAVIVEGASDTLTLWYHNFPGIGLPGATNWDEERDAGLLDGVGKIYVVIEPDDGGKTLLPKLAGSAIRDRLRIVRMSPEAKDPSALYLQDTEKFVEKFQALLDAAEPPPPPPPPESDPIADLNKTYAVIRIANRVVVLNEYTDDEGLPSFSLLPVDNFKLWTANQKIEINDKKVPIAPVWIAHPQRRQYEGLTFAPGGAPPRYYNLWTGFAYQPSETGCCDLFKNHLRYNVCDDRAEWYGWVWAFFADIFKNPTDKPGTSLVLRGEMGVGKTIVGKTFGKLLGLHYKSVADPRYVTGRFNAHMVRCLLLLCDEAFWAGDLTAVGKVRDLVTGDRHPIEFKGLETEFVRNYIRLLVIGPPGWIVPAGLDERRFATFDVAETQKQNSSYFRAIEDQLKENNDSGYKRLLFELQDTDLSKVDLRNIPRTDALLDQKIAGMSPEDAWWFDILQSGILPHYSNTALPGRCPGQLLYDHYIERANKQGVRRRQIETALGIWLRKYAAPVDVNGKKLLSWTDQFTIKDAVQPFGSPETSRGVIYAFPELKECRDHFVARLQQSVEWEGPIEWKTAF